MRKAGTTKTRTLDEGKKLIQTVGYNGFSFQHLADAVGVRKQSLYEHFESKEDLGASVIEEYRVLFLQWKDTVSVFEPDAQVAALFEVFFKIVSEDKKLCGVSSMVGDFNSFTKGMKKGLVGLYDDRKAWLIDAIKAGQKKKIFRKDQKPEQLADFVIAIGLGSQLSARVSGNVELVHDAKKQALEYLLI